MSPRTDPNLQKQIDRFNSNYEKGGDWFDSFAKDATIYTIGSTEPFKGRSAYEQNFKKLLKEKRKLEILNQDVQLMGETAVVMELQRVTQSGVTTHIRQSTIWKQYEGGDWKVVHMHSAAVGTPSITDLPKNPRAIKVLADKIATVSAQTGVAQ